MKNNIKKLYLSISYLTAFVLWTIAICNFDLNAIGPNNSIVGFSTINSFVHNLVGTNTTLYYVTDWLGLVPVFAALCFATLGLVQWIKRKNILKVDFSILILGVHYIITIFTYFFFEYHVINYRPIIINGYLEASYPSSTTLLVLCIMPTTLMQLEKRIKNNVIKNIFKIAIIFFVIFMLLGRLVSGVHWLTDIIGSILISNGLIFLYSFICSLKKELS